jgi:hypothetical protein
VQDEGEKREQGRELAPSFKIWACLLSVVEVREVKVNIHISKEQSTRLHLLPHPPRSLPSP